MGEIEGDRQRSVRIEMGKALARITSVERDRWPIASRAFRNCVRTGAPRFMWGDGAAMENVTQTFSYSFVLRDADEGVRRVEQVKAVYAMLDDLELALEFGHRRESESGQTMGGVRELLGRGLRDSDEVVLRVLQEPALYLDVPIPSLKVLGAVGCADRLVMEVGLQVISGG